MIKYFFLDRFHRLKNKYCGVFSNNLSYYKKKIQFYLLVAALFLFQYSILSDD